MKDTIISFMCYLFFAANLLFWAALMTGEHMVGAEPTPTPMACAVNTCIISFINFKRKNFQAGV